MTRWSARASGLLLFLLAPLVSYAETPAIDNAMSTFGNCLGQRAEAYAPQNAEPSDIANAAVSDCDAQLNAYRTATLDHFKTLLPRDPKLARSYSDRLTNETREKGRKAVISKVLQLRTK